jgi:hypothetical protein
VPSSASSVNMSLPLSVGARSGTVLGAQWGGNLLTVICREVRTEVANGPQLRRDVINAAGASHRTSDDYQKLADLWDKSDARPCTRRQRWIHFGWWDTAKSLISQHARKSTRDHGGFGLMFLFAAKGRGQERGLQAMCATPSPRLSPWRGRGVTNEVLGVGEWLRL